MTIAPFPLALGDDALQRAVDALPLRQQLLQDRLAVARQAVETLPAFLLLAPLAREQPLALEAPQERVERALVDREAVLLEGLAQRVAVVLTAQLGEHRQ